MEATIPALQAPRGEEAPPPEPPGSPDPWTPDPGPSRPEPDPWTDDPGRAQPFEDDPWTDDPGRAEPFIDIPSQLVRSPADRREKEPVTIALEAGRSPGRQ